MLKLLQFLIELAAAIGVIYVFRWYWNENCTTSKHEHNNYHTSVDVATTPDQTERRRVP